MHKNLALCLSKAGLGISFSTLGQLSTFFEICRIFRFSMSKTMVLDGLGVIKKIIGPQKIRTSENTDL